MGVNFIEIESENKKGNTSINNSVVDNYTKGLSKDLFVRVKSSDALVRSAKVVGTSVESNKLQILHNGFVLCEIDGNLIEVPYTDIVLDDLWSDKCIKSKFYLLKGYPEGNTPLVKNEFNYWVKDIIDYIASCLCNFSLDYNKAFLNDIIITIDNDNISVKFNLSMAGVLISDMFDGYYKEGLSPTERTFYFDVSYDKDYNVFCKREDTCIQFKNLLDFDDTCTPDIDVDTFNPDVFGKSVLKRFMEKLSILGKNISMVFIHCNKSIVNMEIQEGYRPLNNYEPIEYAEGYAYFENGGLLELRARNRDDTLVTNLNCDYSIEVSHIKGNSDKRLSFFMYQEGGF